MPSEQTAPIPSRSSVPPALPVVPQARDAVERLDIDDAAADLEKIRLFYKNAETALIVSLGTGASLVYVNGHLAPPAWSLAWWAFAILASLDRCWMARRFARSNPVPSAAPYWRRRAILGAASTGLCWAVGAMAFMATPGESVRLFTVIVEAGMMAGGLATLSPVPSAFRAFLVPNSVAIIIAALARHGEYDWPLAFVSLVYLAALWRSATYFHDHLDRSARLALSRTRLAERFDQARREAELASKAKSQFLATMSHEIRTPMNGVLGMAQLLLSDHITDNERRTYARVILNSGRTLLTLLNDILDLSKVEAGKMELSRAAFAPSQLVAEIVALFEEPARAKGLTLEATWDGPPAVRYWSDPLRLRQMLSNLVGNSIKFTEHGGIRIRVAPVSHAGAATLEFSVTDTGIGISEAQQARLFTPFTQVDAGDTRRYDGTGLGLSIVRQLAQLLGGDATCASTPGAGSTFSFTVVAERAEDAEDTRAEERIHPPEWPQAPGRILVVEDNFTNRLVIESALEKLGHSVRSVEDGQQAIDAVTSGARDIDLVLMDCQMPGVDGFEATRQIRAWEHGTAAPRLPIVALTAGAFEKERERCYRAGMDDFMAKPLDIASLATVLSAWLAERRRVTG